MEKEKKKIFGQVKTTQLFVPLFVWTCQHYVPAVIPVHDRLVRFIAISNHTGRLIIAEYPNTQGAFTIFASQYLSIGPMISTLVCKPAAEFGN